MILLSLLFSFAALFMVFVLSVYLLITVPLAVRIISYVIAIVVFFIVSVVVFIAINYQNIYEVSFWELLKNSFLIAFSKPLSTIGFFLLANIFFYLLVIPIRIPIFILLVLFIGFSYFLSIEFLYTSSLFDEYINKKAHESLVDKGMKKN